MARTQVTLQQIVTPMEGFPGHLFVREGLSRERGADRVVPEASRWDFSVSHGRIVRDNRYSEPDPSEDPAFRIYREEEGCFVIDAGATVDFSCYFNMLSAAKWLKLTGIESIALSLDIEGEATLDVRSYRLDDFASMTDAYGFETEQRSGAVDGRLETSIAVSADVAQESRGDVEVRVGSPDATLLGFSLTAKTEVRLYHAAWKAEVDEAKTRRVDLCIATTTFKKEDFITRNVKALQAMMAEDAELAEHLRVIVVDNGRTLDPATLEDARTSVYGNNNVGGAGGFARGMIEAMRMSARPTHIIIMDDDVYVHPETIKRTYRLLTLLKPEYQDRYISGAMLRYETRDVQHEDIGRIDHCGFFRPKKPAHKVATIADCASNEVEWPTCKYEYAAWWFCCIPMKFVREDSLPIPVFVRGDDVEFSLRNQAEFISMNGIGVWHVGFGQKFSASMEYYQVVRNSFILRAFHPHCEGVNFLGRVNDLFTQAVCKFAYDYADLVLDALEDYLQGPSIIEKPNGIDVVKEKSKANEEMRPLSEVWTGDADFGEIFSLKGHMTPKAILWRRFTEYSLNGQLALESRVTDEVGFAPYDWEFRYRPIHMKRKLVSISPVDASARMHERDNARFIEVLSRKVALFDRYEEEHERVEAEYREAYPRFTSLAFWQQYLGLDE